MWRRFVLRRTQQCETSTNLSAIVYSKMGQMAGVVLCSFSVISSFANWMPQTEPSQDIREIFLNGCRYKSIITG